MEIEEEKEKENSRMSSEIVEVEEDGGRNNNSVVVVGSDVFVAVGKKDLDVVKWAVDHAVSPGARIYLVHVFSPVNHIHTPVGKLSRSQLSEEQAQIYVNEENNKRRSLLHNYIRLCVDAKVGVETMLLESNDVTKAILDLVQVANITNLVMGTKRPSSSRRWRKGLGKGEFVKKNAPDFCDVTIIYDGRPVVYGQQRQAAGITPSVISTVTQNEMRIGRIQPERKFFECACFSGKFD